MKIAGWALAALNSTLLACGPPEVTFSRDIAPILQAKCQSCHRPGQMAPMSLLSYEEVRPFSAAIRTSVAIGNMPPFYAAGPPGYFKNDIRLTAEEKELIFRWADSGAPEGDRALLPEPVEWDDAEWPFGEPDLVIRFPRHSPPPVLEDHFVTLVSDHVFPEETWVRALHLKTESKKVVHHSTQFLWNPALEIPPERKAVGHVEPKRPLFTWFPGFRAEPLPPGKAIQLPRSARVAALTHFGPTRENVSEELQLGIYFADGTVDSLQKPLGIQLTDLRIPPGEANYTRKGTKRFPEDATVSHFRVHMHLRGKSSKIILHYPDGTQETVFDLPRYRFSWQRYYYLSEVLEVPKGTTAEFIGVWDNSEANPLNPNPSAWCSWGPKTSDEMFGATIFYTPKQKLQQPVEIVQGVRVDGQAASDEPVRGRRRHGSTRLF